MSACRSGAMASVTDRCWRTAAGSWSHTVVPSVIAPARLITPVATSSASANVVFPAPDGPTRATLRIRDGSCAATAGSGRSPLPFVPMAPTLGYADRVVDLTPVCRSRQPPSSLELGTLSAGPTYDRVLGP